MGSDLFKRAFLREGQEPLTDELIQELVKKYGMPEGDLRELQKMGATYCRERNSFHTIPQANG